MSSMEWILLILVGTFIFYCCNFLARNYNYWHQRGFPCIKTVPIIETLVNILLIKKPFQDQISEVYKKLDGHKFGGYFVFHRPVLMILDPDLISQILITDFVNFQNRGVPVAEWEPLGASIHTLSGDAWRILRHKLAPTFSSVKVRSMFDQIKECSDILIKYIQTKNEPLDVKYLTEKFNINVIACVALGLCPHKCEKGKKSALFEISCRFFKPSVRQILRYLIRFCFPKISHFLKIQMIDDESHDFFLNLIHDIIKHRETTGEKRNDFLQSMMDIKDAENVLNSVMSLQECVSSNPDETEKNKNLMELNGINEKTAEKFGT